VGPWYTLPDEFLVSGETLVRNLARGIPLAQAHGGSMRVGYLPDSFGHAAQMPQIYRQFGMRHAVVMRGVPRAIDRVAFEWVAPDGSTVLAAYLAGGYGQGVDLPSTGRTLERLPGPLATLTGLPAQGFLREAWTYVLQNAAHDTACGSGIDAVSVEARGRSDAAQQLADAVVSRGLARVAAQAGGSDVDAERYEAVVWNPSPFTRAGLVELEVSGDHPHWTVETPDGRQAVQSLA